MPRSSIRPDTRALKVAAEEVKALAALSEVNHSRLVRMQLQPQSGQHLPGQLLGRAGLSLAAAEHDEVVRVADEPAVRPSANARSSACR